MLLRKIFKNLNNCKIHNVFLSFFISIILIFVVSGKAFAITDDSKQIINFDTKQSYQEMFIAETFQVDRDSMSTNNRSYPESYWLWGLIMPGLGHIFMGEIAWGVFYIISFSALVLISVGSILISMQPQGVGAAANFAGIIFLPVAALGFILLIVLYLSSTIHANFLNKDKVRLFKENLKTFTNIISKIQIANNNLSFRLFSF